MLPDLSVQYSQIFFFEERRDMPAKNIVAVIDKMHRIDYFCQ